MSISFVTPSGSFARLCTKFPILILIPIIIIGFLIWLGYPPPVNINPDTIKSYRVVEGKEYFPVIFAFDDGKASVFDHAYPYMEKIKELYKIDIPAMAFIITDNVGTDPYMSKSEIVRLNNSGWDIGSHTVNHVDLTSLNQTDLARELSDSKAYLNGLGITVHAISSPDGLYNSNVINEIQKYYYFHRGSDSGLNSFPPQNRYILKSVFYEGSMSVSDINGWVDKAFSEKKVLIITFHNIDDKSTINDKETLKYSTDIKDFNNLVNYVAAKYIMARDKGR
jgi:peptidoglycan/xylan/chitin deacetylase (PgdA/CDA1 family)